jgi:GntR family transcriptional repressor for pyruvate dehydrogenase complex
MDNLDAVSRISAIEQSSEILKAYIMEGNLKIGNFLPPEMELCKRLGIGRSTLREAIKILELQGFIKKKQGVGMMVVNESDKAALDMLQLMLKRNESTMEELTDVRNIIEVRTSELAAIHATPEDIREIEEHVQVMKNSIATQTDYFEADIGFHLAIAKASHNSLFQFILNTIRPLIEEMIQETLKTGQRPEQSMKYHEKIFEAIRQNDPDSAVKAMKEHLEASHDMINYN